jgi:hypothetical protein
MQRKGSQLPGFSNRYFYGCTAKKQYRKFETNIPRKGYMYGILVAMCYV